jgi:methyl-accepting chemotaxis protein
LVIIEIILIIGSSGVLAYFESRIIFLEVKKGNLDVSIMCKGNDELSVLSESFNSMVASIRNNMKKAE